ncbi:MAG: DUF4145 domain-containing protein [Rhodospirillales bacterium]|nr:DUF4145 domain-containing protein [Rhodospirillales bacterium]
MECPHCTKHFHEEWSNHELSFGWFSKETKCPACRKVTIELWNQGTQKSHRAYPLGAPGRQPVDLNNIPHDIVQDYEEACAVLAVSAKASAALARRCLQAILQQHGYSHKNLIDQIKAVLTEKDPKKSLPQSLQDTMDAIRNFGNFSAHPMTDGDTLQVIDVEPEEAEWCLEILEELFDHYYDKPAIAATKKAALDAKLQAAGKQNAL